MTGKKDVSSQLVVERWRRDGQSHALWLDGYVGYIIQRDSPILVAMPMFFKRTCEQHS